jgi:lipopolysaccharide transport system ATP-binding protein
MNNIVIKVENVSKKYCKRLRHTMLYGIADIARSTLGLSPNSTRLRQGEFWAVDDISFEVKRGETLGIIGPNGAGKTTILKLLNGILMPDKGEIRIKGRVGALIEVGAGFHPMLTGRENVYVNGAILGMGKREIDKKFDAIIDFADVGDFIDSPVKHYSSGMHVRLGFAIAVHCEPDILLVDEVLAVGDAAFQNKCFTKLRKYSEAGGTSLFVSHNLSAIVDLCKETLLFFNGKLKFKGLSNAVINVYKGILSTTGEWPEIFPNFETAYKAHRFGVGGARIEELTLLNEKGQEVKTFFSGEKLKVRFYVRFERAVEKPVYGLTIKDKNGLDIYMTDTLRLNKEVWEITAETRVLVEMRFRLPLITNTYFVTPVISESGGKGKVCLDGIFDAVGFNVIQEDQSLGIVNFEPEFQVSEIK